MVGKTGLAPLIPQRGKGEWSNRRYQPGDDRLSQVEVDSGALM